MTLQQPQFARRSKALREEIDPRILPERRRHRRVRVDLLGRFMRENKQEYPCKLEDISVGGAHILSPVLLEHDERVIAYFEHIGGIEGTVVRTFDGGFALKLRVSAHKREKLAAQLTWLINRHEVSHLEERRHERLPVAGRSSKMTLPDGRVIKCDLQDISLSGASVRTEERPEIGARVVLGRQSAVVRRHHEAGIGVQFEQLQERAPLDRCVDDS